MDTQETKSEPSFFSRHKVLFFVLGITVVLLLLLLWGNAVCKSSSAKHNPPSVFCSMVGTIQKALSTITSPLTNLWKRLVMFIGILLGAFGLFLFAKGVSLFGGLGTKRYIDATVAQDEGAKVALEEDRATGEKRAVLVDKDGKIIPGISPTKEALEDYNKQVRLRQAANEHSGPLLTDSEIDRLAAGADRPAGEEEEEGGSDKNGFDGIMADGMVVRE